MCSQVKKEKKCSERINIVFRCRMFDDTDSIIIFY